MIAAEAKQAALMDYFAASVAAGKSSPALLGKEVTCFVILHLRMLRTSASTQSLGYVAQCTPCWAHLYVCQVEEYMSHMDAAYVPVGLFLLDSLQKWAGMLFIDYWCRMLMMGNAC